MSDREYPLITGVNGTLMARAATAAEPPSETADVFAREQADLAAVVPSGIAPVGTVLPDAELLDVNGAATTLSAVAGGTSVLVFYRGAWCPYCNIALSVYQAHLLPALAERGIPLIAISPQKPDGSLTMQQKHDLAFTVASDPGNVLAGRLGILTGPSPEARAVRWIDVHPGYSTRAEPRQVIEALDDLPG